MNLIEAVGLTKRFNGTEAVKRINVSVREGVCTALLGPNGAGKTTTLNMITGLIKPTEGSVTFSSDYPGDRRQYIGYLPQYPQFYRWMTGEEYTMYSAELAGLPKKKARERTNEMLELVGLADGKKKKIGGYSGGMKQRLGIAQALVHEPPLIILDEPVSALDPIGRREILELMKRLKQQTSILFSTHVLHDAEEVSDDIFIMKQGEIIVEGGFTELQRKYQQPAFYIETEENMEKWAAAVKEKEWISRLKHGEHKATLTVTELETARKELLKDPRLHDLKIVKFEVAKTSLEDLFMKVMT